MCNSQFYVIHWSFGSREIEILYFMNIKVAQHIPASRSGDASKKINIYVIIDHACAHRSTKTHIENNRFTKHQGND